MRDLTRETPLTNGHEAARTLLELEEDAGLEPLPAAPRRLPDEPTIQAAIDAAQRDRGVLRVATLVLGAAKALDPILRIVMARVLALGALVAASALTAYTLAVTSSWERVATCGMFLLLAALLIRKGQS